MKIVNPENLPAPRGYNHGILCSGNMLFISGQIGWDSEKRLPASLPMQFEQALRNILSVLESAGGKTEHICRFTIYIKDKADYLRNTKEIGLRYQMVIGKHYPAMSLLVISDLLEDAALVEIEATAVIP
jgi:enamine deaminase RidA (YjgF/YER057c/UK114 family)